jgi:hypothetical protein
MKSLDAPELDIPAVEPLWERSAKPAASGLKVRSEAQIGEPELNLKESEASATEGLAFEEVGDPPFARLREHAKNMVESSHWVYNGELRQAVLTKSGILWLDPEGAAYLRDSKTGTTLSIKSSRGPVTAVAADEKHVDVYVVSGGMLQRWALSSRQATVVQDEKAEVSGPATLEPARGADGKLSGILARIAGGTLFWTGNRIWSSKETPGEAVSDQGPAQAVRFAGQSFYLEKAGSGTRVLLKGQDSSLRDLGTLPYDVKAVALDSDEDVVFAAVPEGLVEWDVSQRQFRLFRVDGLAQAVEAAGGRLAIDMAGDRALLVAGSHVFDLDISEARRFLESEAARIQMWAEKNPMSVKDGMLRIGEFKFSIAQRQEKKQPWYTRLLNYISKKTDSSIPSNITETEWRVLNLPSNKWVIYNTLKAFTLNQHVLYIGETGGGKTYIAQMIAKLTGNELWMASLNEYTKNQDLIARETFGEEGSNKTGLTPSTILQWMTHGGILLLDEMHKPLEGISVINNILQNGEYRMADGRVIKYDKTKSWVIGTMNPVKPPYRGEPPSGELSSRFGTTLQVNYLPPMEERALLSILFPGVDKDTVRKLVSIANDLRKVYPEVLPLPIAPRTLLHIAEHISRFPWDDPADIFMNTYNPSSIVEDPAIRPAIQRALEAHGLGRMAAAK